MRSSDKGNDNEHSYNFLWPGGTPPPLQLSNLGPDVRFELQRYAEGYSVDEAVIATAVIDQWARILQLQRAGYEGPYMLSTEDTPAPRQNLWDKMLTVLGINEPPLGPAPIDVSLSFHDATQPHRRLE